MNNTPDPALRDLSRRRVLQIFGLGAAGVAAAGSLAACAKGGGGNTGTSGEKGKKGGEGGKETEFHGAWPYELPPAGHFNAMAGILKRIIADTPYMDLICLPAAFYMWADKKFEPVLAESWNLDEAAKTYTLKIKSGLKWSDGKPVTSADVAATFWCRRVMRQNEWLYLTGLEVKDEQTVVFQISEASPVLERYILRATILSAATYGAIGKEAEAFFKAGKDLDKEGQPLNDKLQNLRPDDIIANGPYKIDPKSVTNAQLTLPKNPTGYQADKVNFDKLVIFKGETIDVAPLVAAKTVDYATHGFAVAQVKSFQEKGFRILKPAVYGGPAIYFNFAKLPEFADPRARQAIAKAIDHAANGTFSLGESAKAVVNYAGFSDLQVPEWMSTEDQAKLNKYEFDQDAAAKLLEAAGWKRAGGKWQLPNGKAASYDLGFPSDYADWAPAGKNAAEQLSTFGIEVKQNAIVSTQLDEDIYKGKFNLAIHPWGAGNVEPSFAFTPWVLTYNIPTAKNQGGKGIAFAKDQTTKAFGKVDIEALHLAAGSGMDLEKRKAAVSKLALVFNELLPIVPLWERFGNNACLEGVRVKKWPADDDPILKNAPYSDNFAVWGILQGTLEAV